jgi:hypothetical protein
MQVPQQIYSLERVLKLLALALALVLVPVLRSPFVLVL